MRVALWFLALFAIAVAAALFAGNNPGSVTFFWPPYRIDISLNLLLLCLIGLFFALHLAWRTVSALLSIPREARRWRLRQRERALQQALIEAISQLLSGRFVRARKSAERVLVQVRGLESGGEKLGHGAPLQAFSHLLAAESAHALSDRSAREQHFQDALTQAGRIKSPETREGIRLRAARWALDDRDAAAALQLLEDIGVGGARRTLALRVQLKAARMAQRPVQALETARLLAKHHALSETAAQGVLRGLAIEHLNGAHDPTQLNSAWAGLDLAERAMPDVAMHAAERQHLLGGDTARAREWLLPVWERMLSTQAGGLAGTQRVRLVQTLEAGFANALTAPDADWLARIETAQMQNPGDALLQYLAGTTCLRLQLWGKARQLLTQSLTRLQDASLRRGAWRQLAELAQQQGDAEGAATAWRQSALS